ncbi:MAG: aminoglycoside phosphotransferase family protein [Anaerolineae bacterium]|nr:aminoglycoside phosphotransferase family protein [Anaerolineae bacterium]
MAEEHTITIQKARAFLAGHLGVEPSEITQIGEGAWSRCFGFSHDGQDLVIRFGKYVSDFQKDQLAYRYATPALPIPEVLEIGQAMDDTYYAISRRVYGVALESVSAEQWLALVPAVVAALEAMRTADLSATVGFGGWDADGNAFHRSWSDRLLSVGEDTPDQRGHGWRKRLAKSPQGEATFAWGFDLLKQIVDDTVPRGLLHCDLTNRNVMVNGEQITGVLDWGCSVYGDHLYDLARFEFWSPWHPQLDIESLKSAVEQRWAEEGYVPENKDYRLVASHLHIGLEHLAYHAHLGDWTTLSAIAERMRALVNE